MELQCFSLDFGILQEKKTSYANFSSLAGIPQGAINAVLNSFDSAHEEGSASFVRLICPVKV